MAGGWRLRKRAVDPISCAIRTVIPTSGIIIEGALTHFTHFTSLGCVCSAKLRGLIGGGAHLLSCLVLPCPVRFQKSPTTRTRN